MPTSWFTLIDSIFVRCSCRAKTCPHRPQAFNEANKGQEFPQENNFLPPFFLNKPIASTPRHVCKTFDVNIWLRKANIKSYFTPKVDSILKLSNYYVTTQITHVFRTKVQMFTPFLEIDSKFGTRVPWFPTQPLTNVLFCFFVGNFESLNIRKTKQKKLVAKNTHTLVNGWVEVHRTRVPHFGEYLQKTAWTLDAEQIWGDMLEPACRSDQRWSSWCTLSGSKHYNNTIKWFVLVEDIGLVSPSRHTIHWAARAMMISGLNTVRCLGWAHPILCACNGRALLRTRTWAPLGSTCNMYWCVAPSPINACGMKRTIHSCCCCSTRPMQYHKKSARNKVCDIIHHV